MRKTIMAIAGGVVGSLVLCGPAMALTETPLAPAVPGTAVTSAPQANMQSDDAQGDDSGVVVAPPGGLSLFSTDGKPAIVIVPAEKEPQGPALPYAGTDSGADNGRAGLELKIPGVGAVGALPKMDFGLELLYGNAPAPQAESGEAQSSDDDVTIRGTLKRRF